MMQSESGAQRESAQVAQIEDARNRERVTTRIGRLIEEFFSAVAGGREFHLEELERFVAARAQGPVAAGSVSRIMRHLRQTGRINYELVSRRDSLYREVTP